MTECRSAGSPAGQHGRDRSHEDFEVEPQTLCLDVLDIQLNLTGKRDVAAAVDRVAVLAGKLETMARNAPASKLRAMALKVERAYWRVVEVLEVESARCPRRT